MNSPDVDVAVVGAGPVGLFLALALVQRGVRVRVLEQAASPRAGSRSIGIHPPSLDALEALEVVEAFLARGVRVTGGRAFARTRPLGRLDFARLPGRYPFVLTVPQADTEAILTGALERVAPGALERGVRVTALREEGLGVRIACDRDSGEGTLRARFVVGCDGPRSAVRAALGVAFPGGPYGDSYVMGDARDDTRLGTDAGIYLAPGGLVESFPLPGGVRRWVVKTRERRDGVTAEEIAALVEERVGETVDPGSVTMTSAFGVERRLAHRFASGRIVLAGDAAHVVSPIGGQGMNLGWLDAAQLAPLLARALGGAPHAPLLEGYARTRRRAAVRAIRRAAFNTVLGRDGPAAPLRNAFVWTMLNTPLEREMARRFTMHGL